MTTIAGAFQCQVEAYPRAFAMDGATFGTKAMRDLLDVPVARFNGRYAQYREEVPGFGDRRRKAREVTTHGTRAFDGGSGT